MPFQVKNNASATLAAGISAAATSLTLATGKGALFPTPSGTSQFNATLVRASDGALEIVRCTAIAGDVLTVTRAQEGTTALAFVTGDKCELRITAAVMDNIPQLDKEALFNGSAGTSGQYLQSQGPGVAPQWATVQNWPEVWTPTNSSPANAATGITAALTMIASGYYDLYGFGQAASQWQISAVSNFASTVYSSGDVAAGTSRVVNIGAICSPSTTYYWRVRYKDNNGVYSAWSTGTSFTTAANMAYSIEYLAMGGGSAGGASNVDAGGGSAGNHLTGTTTAMTPNTGYAITVGAGGTGGTSPTGGSASQIGTAGSIANSAGGVYYGASGGGIARGADSTWSGGGGAGASGVGGNAAYKSTAGSGGAGATWSDGVTRGGGGGGGMYPSGSGAGGGTGGGGTGGQSATAGTVNTGSGGGGAGSTNAYSGTKAGGAGGSGIVILRYAGTQQLAAGGTVTIAGGYVYHTFTTSGTFTP